MQGNSLEHITKFLELVIEKYDRFVKDLHVTFMNYIETMYDNLVRTVSVYWNRILQNIEPQIIRSIHYIESILWGISNEIFGKTCSACKPSWSFNSS
jgi:cellulose biosynthesis protein BcsQ